MGMGNRLIGNEEQYRDNAVYVAKLGMCDTFKDYVNVMKVSSPLINHLSVQEELAMQDELYDIYNQYQK